MLYISGIAGLGPNNVDRGGLKGESIHFVDVRGRCEDRGLM